MFYVVKFVYVNLQIDGQDICPQKSKKFCTKSLNWRSVKFFGVDIFKWDRFLSPCFGMACETWSIDGDHVSIGIIVAPIVILWLLIDNS